MYFGSTKDVEKCQPNAMKNVVKEKPHFSKCHEKCHKRKKKKPTKFHKKPHFSKCHEKCHKRKKKSHTSPGVEMVQLRTNRNSRYDGMWQYHQVQQCR